MTNLVAELREKAHSQLIGEPELLNDAADEIERLREVLTRLIDSPHMEIEGYEIAREALEPRRADEPVKP